MILRVVGDVHGELDRYRKLVQDSEYSVALGEFGFSYKKILNLFLTGLDTERHFIVPGNHDLPIAMADMPNAFWHPGFGLLSCPTDTRTVFFVRGAKSVDKALRIEGRDWFREEELSYHVLKAAVEMYENIKPQVVLTHECPASIKPLVLPSHQVLDCDGTPEALQQMLEIHPPTIWVFGHYHKTRTILSDDMKTTFIALGECRAVDINLKDLTYAHVPRDRVHGQAQP